MTKLLFRRHHLTSSFSRTLKIRLDSLVHSTWTSNRTSHISSSQPQIFNRESSQLLLLSKLRTTKLTSLRSLREELSWRERTCRFRNIKLLMSRIISISFPALRCQLLQPPSKDLGVDHPRKRKHRFQRRETWRASLRTSRSLWSKMKNQSRFKLSTRLPMLSSRSRSHNVWVFQATKYPFYSSLHQMLVASISKSASVKISSSLPSFCSSSTRTKSSTKMPRTFNKGYPISTRIQLILQQQMRLLWLTDLL